MNTAIVYYSKHHGNTKKLLDAIAKADSEVTLIDVIEKPDADMSQYDRIGLASGIYFSSYAKIGGIRTKKTSRKQLSFTYHCEEIHS